MHGLSYQSHFDKNEISFSLSVAREQKCNILEYYQKLRCYNIQPTTYYTKTRALPYLGTPGYYVH